MTDSTHPEIVCSTLVDNYINKVCGHGIQFHPASETGLTRCIYPNCKLTIACMNWRPAVMSEFRTVKSRKSR